ncbi:MAG: thiamine diphosphokinase [Clostridia bacterium]|nr:thiamine diphosphokinase [Clostridia bacterium]
MGKALKVKRAIIFGGNLSEINPEICAKIGKEDFVICADAGYKFASANNIKPDLIVGDFDSANFPQNAQCEVIELPTHKNDTDLQFAINLALEKGYNSFILSGVTGGRLDHTLATLSSLYSLSEKAEECFVWDLNSKVFFVSSKLTLEKPNYDCYFSVFSVTKKSKGVSIVGAEYTLHNARLVNSYPLGVSNEFKNNTVEITVKSGKLLVMVVKNNK